MKIIASAIAALTLAPLCVFASTTPVPPKLRLDEAARPVRYAAELTIIPDSETFRGSIDIDIEFEKPQSVLWLNAHDLTISHASFVSGGGPATVQVVPGNDQVTGFDFGKPVSGRGTLHVDYSGKINGKSSDGVFRLKQDGSWYVYSQFEAISARQAFPCFDEPEYKTPWQLTLRVPKQLAAFDNYPAVSETAAPDGMKVVKFAETRPLPSYLVAFAVGPFETVDAGKVGKTPVRIIVPRGRTADAKYALESIPQELTLLERYFGVTYPYPKLDSIAMRVGGFAMENAGLITYDQDLLLADPATDTLARQREAALVTAHEMAHQWFGDLVTTAWWNDIWLNEAFATWMERKIVGEWKPEWHMDISQVDARSNAMNLDSLVSARKIRQPIESYDDIANAFDGITYEKGAAVIAMFESLVGPEKFRDGVQLYVKQHADGNATASDFTAAVSTAAGRNITPAFNTFLDQAGVPVVSVSLNSDGTLHLGQKRSLPIGSPAAPAATWQIPVCVRYGEGEAANHACSVLADPRGSMTLASNSSPQWVLGNDGEKGYYRVNYADGLLAKLTDDHGRLLSEAERVGVLSDVSAEVRSGDIAPKLALSMVPEFAGDSDRHVVDIALDIASLLQTSLVPDALRPKAEQFIRDNFAARAEQLGWQPKPGESDDQRLLRETLVPRVAREGHDQTLIAEASELARKWLVNHDAVSPDMVSGVLQTAAEFGDRDLFDKIHAALKTEKNQQFRHAEIEALSSFRDPALVRAAEQILLTNEFDIRESGGLLFGGAAYPETRDLPFAFVRQNYDAIVARMPSFVASDEAAYLPYVAGAFCDAGHREEVQKFFGPRAAVHTGGPRVLAQVLESIDTCIAQKSALGPELASFLENYSR